MATELKDTTKTAISSLTPTGLVDELLSPKEGSLFKDVEAYKRKHDKDTTNKRKATSDFLANLMKDLQGKILANLKAEKVLDILSYNFLLSLKLILESQGTQEPDKSAFVCCIVNSLGNQFYPDWKKLEKVTISTEKTRGKMSAAIQFISHEINEKLKAINLKIHPFIDLELIEILQKLFNYCAEKEMDNLSHEAKRQHIYKTLQIFFLTIDLISIETIFELIAEGIQLSRAQGGNKEESMKSEKALIQLRDTFLSNLLTQSAKFTKFQFEKILNAISYRKENSNGSIDTDVSKHTIQLIEENKPSDPTDEYYYGLYQEHLTRLILEIPDEVNGAKTDKAQYLYDKGPKWAVAMHFLLTDSHLKNEQVRNKITLCAYVWNQYMNKLKEKGIQVEEQYFIGNKEYMDHVMISNHPRLPEEFKKAAKTAAEDLGPYHSEKTQKNIRALSTAKPTSKPVSQGTSPHILLAAAPLRPSASAPAQEILDSTSSSTASFLLPRNEKKQ
jgi:hypothetical protein